MAIREDLYDPNQLVGDVEVPYLSNPTITGNVRRYDPDNQHAYPYVPGLTGKRLVLEISRNPGNPVPLTLTIDFSLSGETDGFKKAIEEINTAGGTDLQALDAGGYLRLISQHAGFDNYLMVKGGATNTAAALLGLVLSPLQGAISYAGEMSSTSPGPEQPNPQGTQLVGKDEDLTSSVINRAILGMQQYTNRLLREFDRELVGIKEYTGVTLVDGGGSVGSYFALDDSATRIPLKEFMGGSLMDLVNVLSVAGEEIIPIAAAGETGSDIWDGSKVYVTDVCYGGPPWTGSLFGSWNPPAGGDGGTIYDTGVYQKTKHAAVVITAIHGNTLICDAATFLTKLVQPGDTLLIQNATNTYPFDPNGEYVVERVLSETQVQVRAKTQFEDKVWSTSPTPTRPNAEGQPSAYGEVLVPIGFFLPVSQLRFKTNVADMSALDLKIRLMVGKRLREISAAAQARPLANNPNALGRIVRGHVDELEPADPSGPSYLHNASKVKVTTPPAWYGGDAITATRAQAYLDGILNGLKATTADHSGADRIASASITLTGPQALSLGSIRTQISSLLGYYNAHVTAVADKHAAADITAAATSNNWNDGSNPGSGSVQSVLSQIVGQLANNASAADGAVKIGFYQITGGTKTVATGSVRSAISNLLDHVNKHLDGVTGWRHPAAYIDAAAYSNAWYSFGGGTVQTYGNTLLDWLGALKQERIDLSTRVSNHVNGSAEKHADTAITSVNRTNFNGSYVHDCLDDIDGKAGFKAATNYWTAANYFRQINTQGYDITSFGGAISSAGGQINAENGNFRSTYNPGYSSGYTNQMVGKSMVKAWAQCWTPGNSGGSGGVISDGFNVSSCSAVNIHTLQINFASRMKVYASGSNHYGICAVMTPLMFGSPDIPWIPVIWDVDYQAGDWAYWIQVRFMAPTYPSGGDNNDGWWKCYGSPGHNIFFYLSIPGGRQV